MARNAKDSAVSYYHFGRMNFAQPDPGDWGTFLKGFMDGKGKFEDVLMTLIYKSKVLMVLFSGVWILV